MLGDLNFWFGFTMFLCGFNTAALLVGFSAWRLLQLAKKGRL